MAGDDGWPTTRLYQSLDNCLRGSRCGSFLNLRWLRYHLKLYSVGLTWAVGQRRRICRAQTHFTGAWRFAAACYIGTPSPTTAEAWLRPWHFQPQPLETVRYGSMLQCSSTHAANGMSPAWIGADAQPNGSPAEPTSKLRHESLRGCKAVELRQPTLLQLDLRRPKHGDDGVLSDSGTGSRSTVIRDPPAGASLSAPPSG